MSADGMLIVIAGVVAVIIAVVTGVIVAAVMTGSNEVIILVMRYSSETS